MLLLQKLGKALDTGNSKPASANLNPTLCCSRDIGITCSGSKVTEISWANRKLHGSIPEDSFKHFGSLVKLNLSMNAISGAFPKYLADTTIKNL
jgi:hypothetical protein